MGRLAFHAKANPMPMYAGLEEATKRTGKKVILVLAGWFGSDAVRDQFAAAAKILAPTLKVVSVDGRKKARIVGPKRDDIPPFRARPDPFSLFEHYPTAVMDNDRVFSIGDKELEEPIRLAHVARLALMLNAPEYQVALVLDHIRENGPTATGDLLDLVGRNDRIGLRRTMVWLAKVGVLRIHW